MKIFNISKEKIVEFEIPTGNPLLIEFDESVKVKKYKYLDPKRAKKFLKDKTISYRPIHKNIYVWSLEKAKRPGVVGCFASHYSLWELCLKLDETICILEHDARMFSPIIHKDFDGILQINIEDSNSPSRLYNQLNYKFQPPKQSQNASALLYP